MKKSSLAGIAFLAVAFTLAGCKSTESSYKQAYEKAVAQDAVTAEVSTPVEAVKPDAVDVSTVTVREEKVSVVTGENKLKAYGIVCGSFSLKANADALCQKLQSAGYPALVVINEAGKTYRVIVNSFDTKEEAVRERSAFKARYSDNQDFQAAWILYKM